MNYMCKLNCMLNKDKLYLLFKYNGFLCNYEPNIYHGMKIIYYFNNEKNSKQCLCNENKCVCIKTTSILCSNGNILFYGFRNKKQVDLLYNTVINIIN